MKKIYIGIDPGQSGGISFIYPDGDMIANKMPQTEKDISDLFGIIIDSSLYGQGGLFAIIEKVHSMPGQGVASSFKFGRNYGFLRGCLISLGIPFDEVTPQKWMKHFSMKKAKTETKTQWKNRLKGKAQQLYPSLKPTLATADSILISRYCMEVQKFGAKPTLESIGVLQ